MAIRENQKVKYQSFKSVHLLADDSQGSGNSVPANAKVVEVTGYVNNCDDFIVLPNLADCENGHEILILNKAGTNFELRTPSGSAEEINSEDCDGTNEALMTDTQIVKVTKINDSIGWCSFAMSAVGAAQSSVTPD